MDAFIEQLQHEFQLPFSNPVLIFSVILLIIFFAPLLRKIKIPGIVGLIISGIIIGPHGLNFIAKNSAIELFSTIGLLYIMFIAGLDLDMNRFKATRNRSIAFGVLTFIVPIIIGYPVCRYILGFEFNAAFLTAAMFAEHTLIAYPILSKLGVNKDQSVAVTVGGTIIADTAVLIILAIIVGNFEGGLTYEFWLKLIVSLSLFSFIIFWIVPKISKFFFIKMEGDKHSHYIFVLAVVFLAAFLSELSGVEPIIGAFMAGLALNRQIPVSSPLMNRIEFIGNALFIPFFLISVGMLVNVKVIFSGVETLIVAAVMSFVAIFSKWIAAFLTQKIFRYSLAQRSLIFGLSMGRAAAVLAVVLVGYRMGILNETILNGTIILILITCIMSSFVTEKSAIKLARENSLLKKHDDYKSKDEHIILPVAKSENMYKLLELTSLIRSGESLHPVSLLSIVPDTFNIEKKKKETKEELEKFKSEAAGSEMMVEILAEVDYNPIAGIVRVSRDIMANMILVGWPQKMRNKDIISIGNKRMETLIDAGDKNIFIAKINCSMLLIKRVVLLVPPLAELELGFDFWLLKMAKLVKELSIPISIYSNKKSYDAICKVDKEKGLGMLSEFKEFYVCENLNKTMGITQELKEGDLFVMVLSRKGAISYNSEIEHLPSKMEQSIPDICKLAIFPQQYAQAQQYDSIKES